MGRPQKVTVEYFSHDTNASSGRTLFILQNKYGNDGYAFWFKLLELLGRTEGHFYVCNNATEWEYLLAITHVSNDIGKSIIQTLLELGAIDVNLYNANKTIWCQNFIDRLNDVYSRRDKRPQKPIDTSINVDNKPIQPSLITNNDNNNPQSKVKESKVNKTKVKESSSDKSFEDYVLTLKQEFSDINVDEELIKFQLYWSEGGRKLKRPKLALRNWIINAVKYKSQNNNGNGHKQPPVIKSMKDETIEGITVINGLEDEPDV